MVLMVSSQEETLSCVDAAIPGPSIPSLMLSQPPGILQSPSTFLSCCSLDNAQAVSQTVWRGP